jgi:glucose/arabinose dehydrogenase
VTAKALLTVSACLLAAAGTARAQERTGAAAYGDWRTDAPGVVRHITSADMPAPYATHPTALPPAEVPMPNDAKLRVLRHFTLQAFAKMEHPRQLRVAPNGDIFVAETDAGRIVVLRAADGAPRPATRAIYASGLDRPFGIAFYPLGPHPRFVYIANNNSVVRFAYANGDLKATAAPETVVAKLASTAGGHSTRDIDFSKDGKRMLVSVGSGSNLAEGMPAKTVEEAKAWEADHMVGATWGREADRADILSFDPEGRDKSIYASGIRNCVTLRVNPVTGVPWCAVNERDSLGDDLPPDYVTQVKLKGFYGWPWYYIGDHQDPRLKGQRPDLADKVIVPDVLIQPHSAPLGLTFYPDVKGPEAFPAEYRGDAFVALHGSWNRSKRTGYKIVLVKVTKGIPSGTYEDFLTGFASEDSDVWGRPVGVAVAHDGALLVSDDGGGMIWRVIYNPLAVEPKPVPAG